MPQRSSKQPDHQQIALRILDSVTPDAEPKKAEKAKDPAAVSLGRRGGLKGGPARAKKLSAL
jgi:hypothetical protein